MSINYVDRSQSANHYTIRWLSWWCSGLASDLWSKVAGSTPGRGAIKSTRSTQPSIPPGSVNRVSACMAGVRRGAFTCAGWQVTLCNPIWQVTSRSSEMGFPWRAILAFTFYLYAAYVAWFQQLRVRITRSRTRWWRQSGLTDRRKETRRELVTSIHRTLSNTTPDIAEYSASTFTVCTSPSSWHNFQRGRWQENFCAVAKKTNFGAAAYATICVSLGLNIVLNRL